MRPFYADAEALPGGQVTPAVWNVAHGLGVRPPPALSQPRLTPNSARPCCLAMQDPLQFDLVATTLQLQRTSFDDQSSPAAAWWPPRDIPALLEITI